MNSNLQNKLQQFSADPPEELWAKIADSLDAEESFARRLYTYEETPPSANWERIEHHLDAQTETGKVVPLGKRFTKPMRYIAVASLLAVTLVTLTLTMKRTEAGSLESSAPAAVPATSIPITSVASETNPGQEAGSVLEPEQNNRQTVSGPPAGTVSSTADRRAFRTTPINAALSDYVTYNDGNGKVVKVSRKMETYINCSDTDQQCKQRLQQLRQKMAAKAMTTDFTGILEMLQQLQ